MMRIVRIAGRVLLVLALVAILVGIWKREEIARLLAVNSLFSETRIVANFSNMDRAFLHTEVARGDGPVSDLPRGSDMRLPEGSADWIAERHVTALVVLKDGAMVHESYHLGTTANDRRISWSVAKSFLSALFGVVLADGDIASIDDPVTKYAPRLKGTAYDGASIRNVLQMSSGVTFNEDYLDYDSDINRMGRELALGGSMDGFAAGLSETDAPPGTAWQYVSIDTHVIGMVIRRATGRTIPDLLSEKIIRPLGLEAAPYYVTDGEGVAFVLGGLNLRTRDYARFGQMILQDGRFGGRQIVPADWIEASTRPSAKTEAGERQYGYQWWAPPDARPGEFYAHGIYGQFIYFNKPLGVVIASNAADRAFREPGVEDANIAMFRRIAEAAQ